MIQNTARDVLATAPTGVCNSISCHTHHTNVFPNTGRDVLATAPTGTGKTAAYLLPLIGRLMHCSRDSLPRNKAYPAAVILVPTHELVLQVCVCACVCVLCVCVCVCVCAVRCTRSVLRSCVPRS